MFILDGKCFVHLTYIKCLFLSKESLVPQSFTYQPINARQCLSDSQIKSNTLKARSTDFDHFLKVAFNEISSFEISSDTIDSGEQTTFLFSNAIAFITLKVPGKCFFLYFIFLFD